MRALSALARRQQPPRLPCEALRAMRAGEGALRHTTPAQRPPRGCSISGSGSRAGVLAGTRGGDGAPRLLLTHRPGCQVEGKDLLAQSGPVPARRPAAGFLSLRSLLTRGGHDSGAQRAVVPDTTTRAQMDLWQWH